MESKQVQTCSIIWNYSSYYAGVFLCKISQCSKHNWHCTIVFLIFFFVNNISLFRTFIFQWTRYSNVVFWEIGHPFSTCATEGMEGVIQNMYRCIQVERGITPHVYLRIYRHLLFSCFCLKVSCPSEVG